MRFVMGSLSREVTRHRWARRIELCADRRRGGVLGVTGRAAQADAVRATPRWLAGDLRPGRDCRGPRWGGGGVGFSQGVSQSALVEHPPQLAQGAGSGRSEAADWDAGVAGDLGVGPGSVVERGVDDGALPWG